MVIIKQWQNYAACKGVDINLFCPPNSGPGSRGFRYNEAKKICSTCQVQNECLIDCFRMKDLHAMRAGITPRKLRKAYSVYKKLGGKVDVFGSILDDNCISSIVDSVED